MKKTSHNDRQDTQYNCDKEYHQWLQQLITEIDKLRLQVAMQLIAATIQRYWWLGNDITCKQQEQGWGAKVIDRLSVDLQKIVTMI